MMTLMIIQPNKHFTRCSNDFRCISTRSTADLSLRCFGVARSVARRNRKRVMVIRDNVFLWQNVGCRVELQNVVSAGALVLLD